MMWFYIISNKRHRGHSLYILFKDREYYKAVGIKIIETNRKIINISKIIDKTKVNLVFHISQIPPDILINCDDNMKEFMYKNKILLENETLYYYGETNFSSELENKLIYILLNYIKDFIDDCNYM